MSQTETAHEESVQERSRSGESSHRQKPTAETPDGPKMATKRPGMGSGKKRLIAALVVLGALSGASYFAYQNYFYVATDDAMVSAQTTLLASKISGIIVRANVQENERVKVGQVLIEIRPDDFQNALTQQQSDSEALQAETAGAKTNYERTLRLFQRGASTQERLDTAITQLHSLEARQKSAEAQVAQAKLSLEYTKVTAPADGKVGRKSFEVGMLAAAGQPLLGFVEGRDRWVVANLKETDMPLVTEGKKAQVEVDAVPGRVFEGVVESISPTTGATFSLLPPDNATGNFTKVVQRVPVRIKLLGLSDQEVDRLQAGLSAEVKVRIR